VRREKKKTIKKEVKQGKGLDLLRRKDKKCVGRESSLNMERLSDRNVDGRGGGKEGKLTEYGRA